MRTTHRLQVHPGPWRNGVALVLLAVSIVSCSSSARETTSTPGARRSARAGASLEFRELASITQRNGQPCSKSDRLAPGPSGATFVDRSGTRCYLLGPTLLTDGDVHAATVLNTATSQWAVHLLFENSRAVTKIVRTLANALVAVVFNGVVQAPPRVYSGFAGGDIDVTSSPIPYSRVEATQVAASIMDVDPSRVGVRAVDAPST